MANLKYLSGAVFMLQISFLYPIQTKSLTKKFLYYLWVFLYFLSLILTLIQCTIYLYKTPFNLIEEAMVIMNTVIYFSLFINFALLYTKKEKLTNFVRNINANFVEESDNEIKIIKMTKASKLSDKIAYYWSLNCTLSSLMPALLCLIGGKRILPITAWFPYDHEKSPIFELTYIWQFFCVSNLGITYAVLDLVFPCISILISQQFKILGNNFKNCIYKALIESDLSKQKVLKFNQNLQNNDFNEEVYTITKSPKFREKNLNYLKKNIKHHQLLLKFCEDINDILGIFLLGKISAAMFNSLFMVFSLITSGDQALVFGLGSYLISINFELLIYTYSGQILTQNSDKLLWDLYKSPWYYCDPKFQKILSIVQMRACKTVYVRAGNYFTMTAAAYITFVKALGSYVAVLKELTDREE